MEYTVYLEVLSNWIYWRLFSGTYSIFRSICVYWSCFFEQTVYLGVLSKWVYWSCLVEQTVYLGVFSK